MPPWLPHPTAHPTLDSSQQRVQSTPIPREPQSSSPWLSGGFGEVSFPRFPPISHPRRFWGREGLCPPGSPHPTAHPALDSPQQRGPAVPNRCPEHPKSPGIRLPRIRRGWTLQIPAAPHPGTPFSFEAPAAPAAFPAGNRSLAEPAGCPGQGFMAAGSLPAPLTAPDPAPAPQPAPGHEAPRSDAGTLVLRGKRRQGWGQSPVGLSPGARRGQRGPGSRNPAGNEELSLRIWGRAVGRLWGVPWAGVAANPINGGVIVGLGAGSVLGDHPRMFFLPLGSFPTEIPEVRRPWEPRG